MGTAELESMSLDSKDREDGGCASAAATLPDLALLLVLEYVAAYNLDDVVSAGQVCRHWRRVASSSELWRHRSLRSHGLATQAFTRVVTFAPRLRAMDVCWINQISPEDRAVRKAALLRSHCKLTCLTGVMCHRDSTWTHRLLALHGAHLKKLEVSTVDRQALQALGVMPRLRVLQVSGWDAELYEEPVVVFPPVREGGIGPGCLDALEVQGLPRATTISMLKASRRTLRRLNLGVGTTGAHEKTHGNWPRTCNDLSQVLADCCLEGLQELILYRFAGCYHTTSECIQQRSSLEQQFRFCLVTCSDCSPYTF
ncbi:hypothetical protein FOCC_FOCC003311 [Frankliniella occidentalis]|uniref:Uncharacterized protein LOC113204593 n=1 Tax=Frankliniella occidentalis TaxID=133901 RepID=A0A6J1S4K5_FRAOC|nr:uncharacterized protein LOC113204593 [Frankliniella occidentalis]KAE8749843.1 hypothetical protein FOCC_FOCC003311 [Frankliniella occidentalis]